MDGLHSADTCFSPGRAMSPQVRLSTRPLDVDRLDELVLDCSGNQYLVELFQEHRKLVPFMQFLPNCNRLLSQEVMRLGCMFRQYQHGVMDFERLLMASPNQMHHSSSPMPNFCGNGSAPCNGMYPEMVVFSQGPVGWQGAPHIPSYMVKKIMRLEIPADTYPNFNFIGRLLGPRGNSLKRIEASTGCRIFIRGKGSIKDHRKEERLKGRPGYEHLNGPLHILIEAELPANIIDARLAKAQEILEELLKPVDESQDYYKRQQLRELAMLNSLLREGSPHLILHPIKSVSRWCFCHW